MEKLLLYTLSSSSSSMLSSFSLSISTSTLADPVISSSCFSFLFLPDSYQLKLLMFLLPCVLYLFLKRILFDLSVFVISVVGDLEALKGILYVNFVFTYAYSSIVSVDLINIGLCSYSFLIENFLFLSLYSLIS